MMRGVPGRIQSIVNIHNPSIEFHPADPGINTGAVVILVAGGGHNTLERRHRGRRLRVVLLQLRRQYRDSAQPSAARRVHRRRPTRCTTRCRASGWSARARASGISILSRSASWASRPARSWRHRRRSSTSRSTRRTTWPGNPLAAVSSRPDFVGLVYPGPTPFARKPEHGDTGQRAADVHHVGRDRRCAARDLGGRVLRRDSCVRAFRISRCTSTATACTPTE